MKKVILGIALACGLGFSQTIKSNLNGKRIYVHRKDGGDHSSGYEGLRTMLEQRRAAYGYTLEVSTGSPGEADLNKLFDRLYKGDGKPKAADAIDILVFCQGQGDQNVGGGNSTNPFANPSARFGKVNTHIRAGGGLVMVHAAAGREVSWQGWFMGAKLMTDWFVDNYFTTATFKGNQGHFPANTTGIYTLDEETQPTVDSSFYFIRKLFLGAKAQGGLGQPLVSPSLTGEWYHFNGGKVYEDGTGGDATHPNNSKTFGPSLVRGDKGVPDSGIGPVKIIGGLSKIAGTYTPVTGKIRPGVWGREVSPGVFDPKKSATNGRFLYFNPGHNPEEYTNGGAWMGDFFMANLRWVVKDDRGCTDTKASNYNAQATVSEGCITVGLGRDGLFQEAGLSLGRVSVQASGLTVDIEKEGLHTVSIANLEGKVVFSRNGSGVASYPVKGLQNGFYMVRVIGQGKSFLKKVSIL